MSRARHVQRFAVVTTTAILGVLAAGTLAAQGRPQPTVEFNAGWVGFADDGVVSEGLLGGAARFYFLPRVSVGPEIAFIDGTHHSHLMLTGNVTWDLLAPTNGRPRRVSPFLVAGGGLFQTREHFATGRYTSGEGAFTAGGGVRTSLGKRVIAGVDARVGWELHLRVSGLVGFQLGR
jgi:Outer membrane protein beta-barrel domain